MAYLIAALAATAAGPLLYGLLHERPSLTRSVDLFVYVVVPALVLGQILPGAWEDRSLLPVLALGAGIAVPHWLGRASERLAQGTDTATLVLVLSGLLLHALFEGAGLAPIAEGSSAFGLAVVLHRTVEGLLVWWILRPGRPRVAALAGVAAVVLATTAGFLLGRQLLAAGVGGRAVELYQALVAGSLLHVIFHQGRHAHTHGDAHAAHAHVHPHAHRH